MVSFHHELEDDVVVFSLKGDLLQKDENCVQLYGQLVEHLDSKRKKFIVDLAGIGDKLASPFYGLLIKLQLAVNERQAELVIANYQKIKRILILTKLITVFQCFDSLAEAKRHFAKK